MGDKLQNFRYQKIKKIHNNSQILEALGEQITIIIIEGFNMAKITSTLSTVSRTTSVN